MAGDKQKTAKPKKEPQTNVVFRAPAELLAKFEARYSGRGQKSARLRALMESDLADPQGVQVAAAPSRRLSKAEATRTQVRELNRQGNNVNQIAKILNRIMIEGGQDIEPGMLARIDQTLADIRQAVERLT